MIKIIKYFAVFSTFAIIMLICTVNAKATTLDEQLLDITGAEDINTSYSDEYLDKYGISLENPETVSNIGISTVFTAIIDTVKQQLQQPIKLFLGSLGAIFIMAAAKSCVKESSFSCNNIAVAAIATSICPMFVQSIKSVCITVEEGSEFLSGFVPAFSAITLFSGSAGTSAVYNSAMLSFCAFATNAVSNLLLPLLSCALAIAVTDAISPCINLGAITCAVKKIMITLLTLSMVIFIGLLSLQTSISASSDTLAMRASKYIVSSGVPIVGSAVSEAYSSVSASIGVVKNTFGTFGIICLAFGALPSVVSAFLIYISTKSAAFIAEAFQIKELKAYFNDASAVMSIALAAMICFYTMAIISTAMIIMIANG